MAEDGEYFSARLADHKAFCIMSELLAEGWANAAKNWDTRRQVRLTLAVDKSVPVANLTRQVTNSGITRPPASVSFEDRVSDL